jgi:hypothetical protein
MNDAWQRSSFARHGDNWTSEEEQLLAEQLGQGLTIAESSKLLGRSRTAVESKARNLGVLATRARRSGRRTGQRRSASFFLS